MRPGQFRTPEEFARAIHLLRGMGDYWHLPLMEAARDGVIDLVIMAKRDSVMPLGRLRKSRHPAVVVISDDDDTPTGPAAWKCVRQAVGWAHSALVHASGGEAHHYTVAIAAAALTGRMLIIETTSTLAPEWIALLPTTPTLVIVPLDGGAHPIARARGTHH